MSFSTSDRFWHGTTLGCDEALRPWLHDYGSLTQRIQQRCEKFSVLPVCNGLARIPHDEAALLGIAPHQLAYLREVFLLADGKPVVFAHSTTASKYLNGAWQAVRGLGNRSLGTLLFTHPLVRRQPLRFKALRANHPLHVGRVLTRQRNAGLTPVPPIIPDTLWARRSLFTLHGAPLLVTEVFLPEILTLAR